MVMPALPNKALITKGIFGVSVVAITATVGIVSFAQAARPFDNGYNGYGSNAIVAAVHAFQAAVQDAAQAFNSDVNACIGNTQADVSARAAANTFKAQTNTSVHSMSAQFSSPSTLSRDPKVMRNKLNAADTNLNSALTQVDANITSTGDLRQCLLSARTTFRDRIHSAQQALLDAIHNATH
jgi:hypothetical protein